MSFLKVPSIVEGIDFVVVVLSGILVISVAPLVSLVNKLVVVNGDAVTGLAVSEVSVVDSITSSSRDVLIKRGGTFVVEN